VSDRVVDPMLQAFVDVMNGAGVQLGISLLVGGTWLSGTLIPPRMFTEEMGDYVRDAAGEGAESIQTFFHTIGRSWFRSESEREALGAGAHVAPEGDASDTRPFHLHLRAARVISPAGPVPDEGGYVRLRLDQVEGWLIGDLGPAGYAPPDPPKKRGR
jgi:hypothetical protein